MYKAPRSYTVTIAASGTTSDVIPVGDYVIAGVVTPAALTSTAITFTACGTKDGTFMPVYDSDGNQVSLTVAASRAVGLSSAEADAMAPWQWVKLVCGSTEAAARTITLALK